MIPVETLKAVRTIVTHEGCPDGIASAILLHDALPEAKIVFAQYGEPSLTDLVAEPGMLFCDIAPPPERAAAFVAEGAIVLDHHKQARAVVESFGPNGVFADEVADEGVSGAWLAYENVWLPLRVLDPALATGEAMNARALARLAGIRDTWQRAAHDWLRGRASEWPRRSASGPWRTLLALWRPFAVIADEDPLQEMLRVGAPLFAKRLASAKRAAERSWRATTRKGTRLCIFEGLSQTSDAAERAPGRGRRRGHRLRVRRRVPEREGEDARRRGIRQVHLLHAKSHRLQLRRARQILRGRRPHCRGGVLIRVPAGRRTRGDGRSLLGGGGLRGAV